MIGQFRIVPVSFTVTIPYFSSSSIFVSSSTSTGMMSAFQVTISSSS
jgi:hypothetical protein